MRYLLSLIQLFSFVNIFAQISKPVIDTGIINKWPFVENGVMCRNGDYILYNIYNEPADRKTLVIRSTKTSWEFRVQDVENVKISYNSRFAFFQRNDSLCFFELGSKNMKWIAPIKSYSLVGNGDYESIAYLMNNNNKILIIRNLLSNHQREFYSVRDFSVQKDKKTIFLSSIVKEKNEEIQELNRITVNDLGVIHIWSTKDTNAVIKVNNIAFDLIRRQVAFLVTDNRTCTLWYYNEQANKLFIMANNSTIGLKKDATIDDISDHGFSYDGKHLFVTLKSARLNLPDSTASGVDIWNYKDEILQSQQLYEIDHPNALANRPVIGAIDVVSLKIIQLNDKDEDIVIFKGEQDSIVFIKSVLGDYHERNWSPAYVSSCFLASIRDGSRRKIDKEFGYMSIGGKYLCGYDKSYQFLYSFELASGTVHNLSKCFDKQYQLDNDYDQPGQRSDLSMVGWMANDSAVVVYDKYDIWKVDPLGRKAAVCFTKGYGRLHHTVLRLIGGYRPEVSTDDTSNYVLSAYNVITKENGFFSFCFKSKDFPKRLSMGAYSYEVTNVFSLELNWLKFGSLPHFVIKRESASQSPNYFITENFITFVPVSSIYPESEYNWLTSEVINWKNFDRKSLSGVIYKPENFDCKKKYPVIINYYEKLSHHANEYNRPGFSSNNINIPWFVSRGYVVFTPDIRFEVGYPGQSAYNCIISGTKSLFKYPWVDRKRIAIQGHSWGGYETNYIIAHSSLYAAAVSASSVSDFISGYGALMRAGYSRQFFYELTQSRMGCTPWEKTNLYVKNSPVLLVDKVKTPLLMMNNKEDPTVPFSQGIELFTALRRLRKKVWLLQYDKEGHSVSGKASIDYTIRMTQFFDHYCRDLPAPKWMIDGIPARLKGVDSGLELDSSGGKP